MSETLREKGPSAVVFDLGGVLIDWNPRHHYRTVFAGDEEAMERFLATVCTQAWHREHDRGRPFRESIEELAAEHPDKRALIEEWETGWENFFRGPIAETVEVLETLDGRGVPLYGLTNWPGETFPRDRRRFPFLEHLRDILVSGEVGLLKPDPAIFRLMLARFGLAPGHVFYIDDSPRNAEAAERLGIHAHHFTSAASLRTSLAAHGLL